MMKRDSEGLPSSVLIIKPSSIGDIIHTFPAVRALKLAGVTRIDWVVNNQYESLVRLSPYVDEVIPFSRSTVGSFWRSFSAAQELIGFIGAVRAHEYDLIIDLQGLLRSALIGFSGRAKKKIGFADAREGASFFYSTKIKSHDKRAHAIERLMQMAEAIGAASDEVGYDLEIPDKAMVQARELMGDGPFVAINSNARWHTKQWPVTKFAEVGKAIIAQSDATPVIIGGCDDVVRGKELADAIGGRTIDLTGKGDLPFLAAVLQRSEVMVTNDSGPLHLAVAVGTKVVGLYGPTDPAKIGPYGSAHTVIRSGAECAPCRRRECEINPLCMEMIGSKNVINIVTPILAQMREK